MSKTELTGRSVIVTGGTTGIGRAIAYQMAIAGARVLVVGRNAEHLEETLQNAPAERPGQVQGVLADLSNEEGINQLFKEADRQLDGIDILINNAALAAGGLTEGTYEDWEEAIQTNLTAYLACSRFAIDRMKGKDLGHIINIGSMSAHTKEKTSTIYVATKSALRGFSESLRKEVNELGIKVTLIEPGAVDTDMQEASPEEKEKSKQELKMLDAEDVAAAAMYVATQPARCDVVMLQLRPHLQTI